MSPVDVFAALTAATHTPEPEERSVVLPCSFSAGSDGTARAEVRLPSPALRVDLAGLDEVQVGHLLADQSGNIRPGNDRLLVFEELRITPSNRSMIIEHAGKQHNISLPLTANPITSIERLSSGELELTTQHPHSILADVLVGVVGVSVLGGKGTSRLSAEDMTPLSADKILVSRQAAISAGLHSAPPFVAPPTSNAPRACAYHLCTPPITKIQDLTALLSLHGKACGLSFTFEPDTARVRVHIEGGGPRTPLKVGGGELARDVFGGAGGTFCAWSVVQVNAVKETISEQVCAALNRFSFDSDQVIGVRDVALNPSILTLRKGQYGGPDGLAKALTALFAAAARGDTSALGTAGGSSVVEIRVNFTENSTFLFESSSVFDIFFRDDSDQLRNALQLDSLSGRSRYESAPIAGVGAISGVYAPLSGAGFGVKRLPAKSAEYVVVDYEPPVLTLQLSAGESRPHLRGDDVMTITSGRGAKAMTFASDARELQGVVVDAVHSGGGSHSSLLHLAVVDMAWQEYLGSSVCVCRSTPCVFTICTASSSKSVANLAAGGSAARLGPMGAVVEQINFSFGTIGRSWPRARRRDVDGWKDRCNFAAVLCVAHAGLRERRRDVQANEVDTQLRGRSWRAWKLPRCGRFVGAGAKACHCPL